VLFPSVKLLIYSVKYLYFFYNVHKYHLAYIAPCFKHVTARDTVTLAALLAVLPLLETSCVDRVFVNDYKNERVTCVVLPVWA
jgi:hypothetical protein